MDTATSNTQEPSSLGSLPRRERTIKLFEALTNYPKHVPYAERMADLAGRTGIALKTLHQLARRHEWVKRLTLIAEEQQRQQELGKLLDTAHAPGSTDIPFTTLAKGIKNLSMLALTASLQYVSTTAMLIDYYAKGIAHMVALAGGVSHLTDEQAKQVRHWQQELANATKNIQEYIKPAALAQLLQLINFSQNLPTDAGEIDKSAFTIDTLYHRLKEMGMLSAFEHSDKAVEGYGDLPNLSGWDNARLDERQQYGLPPANETETATA